MTEAHDELGRVSSLRADAVGEPGSRRFRLLVESRGGRSAILWLEKEQLFNLGVALKRIIATLEGESGAREASHDPTEEQGEPAASTGPPLEFQVGRLTVGYDERTALYIIAAHAVEDPEDATAMVSLVATQQEVEAVANEVFKVCAAGRPLCPLCGAPMDPDGHICPRHNGHGILDI